MDKNRGLYIHIPFCVRKCLYCDFVSYPGCDKLFDSYVDSVLKEADEYAGEKFETVFIGGGTPTILPANLLDRLLSGFGKRMKFAESCEASVEVNPGTITKEKLDVLKNSMINRISIGVQSFDDRELKALGRIHNSAVAMESIDTISGYFDNFNIDIMTSVPFQTADSLMNTLETAVGTGAKHLSCYSLIVEEGTPFYDMFENGTLTKPSDDDDREMYDRLKVFLGDRGFDRYEISNFAKPGYECRHNIKYWTTNEYAGLGAGAHSYYNGERYQNTGNVEEYISGNFSREREKLTEQDMISEYIMMSMRMSEGIDEKEFRERFGKDFYAENKKKLDLYMKNGFIIKTNRGFSFTDKGFDVSNSILCDLI